MSVSCGLLIERSHMFASEWQAKRNLQMFFFIGLILCSLSVGDCFLAASFPIPSTRFKRSVVIYFCGCVNRDSLLAVSINAIMIVILLLRTRYWHSSLMRDSSSDKFVQKIDILQATVVVIYTAYGTERAMLSMFVCLFFHLPLICTSDCESLCRQESCAIAKMTAWCALYN